MEAAKRKQGKFRIAVLVRARTHLELIARRLRKAEIPFRAVEIEQLSQRQEVKDLTALTRALLHPMDRIAWLSVLRAPWCGLTLRDLHTLGGSDTKDYSQPAMLTLLRERTASLSEDGQRRAARSLAVTTSPPLRSHASISDENSEVTVHGSRFTVHGSTFAALRLRIPLRGWPFVDCYEQRTIH